MEIKNLPEDIAAEQAVLGAILLDKNSIKSILNILNTDDFYREAHKVIYSAMLSLFFHAEPIDMVTLTNYLRSRNKLEAVGGIGYITSLNTVTAANIAYHAAIIKDKAIMRRMIEAGKLIQELGYSSLNREEAVEQAQHIVMQLSHNKKEAAQEGSVTDLFKSCLNRVIMSSYKGIFTGIKQFDELTNGLHTGLISLEGKEGCGKTALALQMMGYIANYNKVAYITDKSIDEIALRLVCSLAGVSCWRFKTNVMQDRDWQKLQESIGAEKNNNMGLYSFNANLIELIPKIREIYSKQKMQVVFLDLQSALQENNEIVSKIKSLAEELNIAILVLFSNYGVKADVNLRLALKKKTDTLCQLHICKHDGGPTGKILLYLDKELLVFREKEKQGCNSSSAETE